MKQRQHNAGEVHKHIQAFMDGGRDVGKIKKNGWVRQRLYRQIPPINIYSHIWMGVQIGENMNSVRGVGGGTIA